MEGDEGGIFSKASDWKSLFLLKIKIKQNTSFPNKVYNAIFKKKKKKKKKKKIKTLGPNTEVKRFAFINDWENIITNWEESEQSEVLANKLGLFQMQLGVWGRCNPRKILQFLPSFKMTQNCHIYMNSFFHKNWHLNHKLGHPISPANMLCLEDCPHNWTKYEINETFKIPISQL